MSTLGYDGARVQLNDVLFSSSVVAASPALAAETIICQVTLNRDIRADQNIMLLGWAALTIGTSGTSVTLRVRRASVVGTLVVSSGAIPGAAAALVSPAIMGVDALGAAGAPIYCLTAQVASGSAPSTVSACSLIAIAV